MDPEQGLTRTLAATLSEELREIAFTTREPEAPQIIWALGFEPGHERTLKLLRQRHANARLVISARDLDSGAVDQLRNAGVDALLEWPAALPRLRAVLSGMARRRDVGA